MSAFSLVVCPTCFEEFEVTAPDISETPCEWDYDCEVCCAPMRIIFTTEAGEVVAEARGLGQ